MIRKRDGWFLSEILSCIEWLDVQVDPLRPEISRWLQAMEVRMPVFAAKLSLRASWVEPKSTTMVAITVKVGDGQGRVGAQIQVF